MVGDFLAALQVFDGDIVSTLLVVPVGADDLVLDLDIFVEGIFPGEVIEVPENLPAASIDSGPVELRLKGPGVVVRRNIASTAIPRRDMFFEVSVPKRPATVTTGSKCQPPYHGYRFSHHVPDTSGFFS